MSKSRKLENVQLGLMSYSEIIREVINAQLPDTGDTEETSQKIGLLNALNQFDRCVEGLTEEDVCGKEASTTEA